MEKSNPDILKELLANPGMSVDQEWCDTMAREYPYFTLPSALELERNANLADNPERKKILTQRIAINSASPEMLYRLTEPLGLLQAGFYPREESKEPATTEEVIDTFINNYGRNDSSETALLEKLIFNPTPDYAQLLSEEEERSLPELTDTTDDSQESRINSFILKSRENYGHFPQAAETPAPEPKSTQPQKEPIQEPATQDDTLLSESLAKIYIKQRRYAKAYEIISNLSLKYPEKSIYFADQLRFLQKLIINQQYIKQK